MMAKEIKNNFEKNSAGSLMTISVPLAEVDSLISSIEEYLLKNTKKLKSINYVYIVSKTGILKGVISIKEIFRQPKSKKVSEVMVKDLVVAHPHTSLERTAYLALKSNIKSIPVLDKDDKFLGAVLSDDILRLVYHVAQKDISRLAGVHHHGFNKIDDISTLSLFSSLKHRLPWLIIGLLGGLLAAQVIGLFESTLAANIILAAFIPLVVYMASAVGTQLGFFIIRDLFINPKLNFFLYTLRQIRVISSMGLIVSGLVFLMTIIFYDHLAIAMVLALAMFLAILSSIITGLLIPYAFSRLRFDPANASGPIATIIQDLMSVTIYLLVAQAFL